MVQLSRIQSFFDGERSIRLPEPALKSLSRIQNIYIQTRLRQAALHLVDKLPEYGLEAFTYRKAAIQAGSSLNKEDI